MLNRKDVFATSYGLETKAFLITSLIPMKQVYGNVIDCWAAVLNHQEKQKTTESPTRLFCYTTTIVSTKKKT